jgi:hypothetical protein
LQRIHPSHHFMAHGTLPTHDIKYSARARAHARATATQPAGSCPAHTAQAIWHSTCAHTRVSQRPGASEGRVWNGEEQEGRQGSRGSESWCQWGRGGLGSTDGGQVRGRGPGRWGSACGATPGRRRSADSEGADRSESRWRMVLRGEAEVAGSSGYSNGRGHAAPTGISPPPCWFDIAAVRSRHSDS